MPISHLPPTPPRPRTPSDDGRQITVRGEHGSKAEKETKMQKKKKKRRDQKKTASSVPVIRQVILDRDQDYAVDQEKGVN